MKKLFYLLSLVMIVTMTSCSADDSARIGGEITPKTLLVQVSRPANSIILEIKDANNTVLETKSVTNTNQIIWNITTGSKFTLTINVDSQTFGGNYQLSEDYGNIVLLSDSFTNHYNSFSTTREY